MMAAKNDAEDADDTQQHQVTISGRTDDDADDAPVRTSRDYGSTVRRTLPTTTGAARRLGFVIATATPAFPRRSLALRPQASWTKWVGFAKSCQ